MNLWCVVLTIDGVDPSFWQRFKIFFCFWKKIRVVSIDPNFCIGGEPVDLEDLSNGFKKRSEK